MSENSRDLLPILTKTQQALQQAQARIAELEERLASTSAEALRPAHWRSPSPRCQKLIECSKDRLTLLDAQRQILYTNAVDYLLGYSYEEYCHIAPTTLVHPEDYPKVQFFFQALTLTPGAVQTLEMRLRHKAGHEVWLEITATNLLHDPEIGALVVNSRDITAAKQTTAALQHNAALFQHAFEHVAVGIAQITLDLYVFRCNQQFCDIIGYNSDELQQRMLLTLTHPDDSEHQRQSALRLQSGEIAVYRTQNRYIHKNGHVIWGNLTVTLVRTSENRPDYFIAVLEDVTQLKQTEEALQRNRERYQQIVEDQLDLICRYNTTLELTFVNQAYCAFFGKAAEDLLGVNFLTLLPVSVHAEVRAKVATLNAANPANRLETVYTLPNGEKRWLEWRDRALCDPMGRISEYQAVGRDITAQKHLQHEQELYTQVIEEMHHFLHLTLDAIAAHIAVLQTDGTILSVNEHWRRFGLLSGAQSSTHYVGENYLTVCDNATGPEAAEAAATAAGIRAVIAGQREHFYTEYPCHSPTKEHWFGLRVLPFAEPAPRHVVIAHIDITERVQAEKAERQQRLLAEAMRDSLVALTASFDVEQVMQRILNAVASVIPSEGASIILFEGEWGHVAYLRGFSPEAEAYFASVRIPLAEMARRNMFSAGKPYFIADTHSAPDWLSLPFSDWIRSSIGMPIALHGEIIGLLCIDSATPSYFHPADLEKLQAFAYYASLALQNAQHVSQLEARVAERTAELRMAKERVEAILNHSFDGIVLVKPDLRIEQTNAPFKRMFGETPGDSFAGSLLDLLHGDDVPRVQTLVQQARATQIGQQIELYCYHKDGTLFDAELSIGPIKDEGIVCTIRDITERKQAETALRESEVRYRLLADNITDWISRMDGKLTFTYVSPSVRMLGYEPKELLGQSGFSLIHPEDLLQIYPMYAETYAQRVATSYLTYRVRHKAGHYIWIETHGRLRYSEETGELLEIIGVSHDITTRKQAEQALAESERRYRLLAENVTDLIGCTNTLGICTYISPSCRTLIGYEPEEMIGQPGYQFIHPDDIATLQEVHGLVLAKAIVPPFLTYRMRHKAGHYLWMEMSSRTVYDSATGEVLEFVNVARNITERKQAEVALRESEARYRLLADNITDMVSRINGVGEYTYVSPSSEILLGYAPEELIGQSAYRFIHPDDLSRIQEMRAKADQTQAPSSNIACRMRHKAGHYLWMEFASHLIWSGEPGILAEAVVSMRDITERKQAEERLYAKMEEEREFQAYLKALHEVTLELAMTDPIDRFYQRVVELGRERLGFERLGVLLYDESTGLVTGTYGTDAAGNVIAEPQFQFQLASRPHNLLQRALNSKERFVLETEAPLFTGGARTGTGWKAATVLRHGEQNLGWLTVDNGVHHQSVPSILPERLALYSISVSTMLARKQLSAALRESEEKFRLLLEVAPVAIVIADQQGLITLANRQAEQIFGYTRDELLAQPVELLLPEAIRVGHAGNRATYLAMPDIKPMGLNQALFGRRKDGLLFPIEVELAYVKTATGLLVMSFIINITERKEAAAALREQRDFLQLVINHVPDLISVKDSTGRFQLVNEASARLHQLTPVAMLGKTAAEVNPNPTEVAFFHQTDQETFATGKVVVIPEQMILGRYYQTTKIPLKNAAGETERLLIVSFDITERKAAEATEREQRAFLQQVLDNIPSVITVKDQMGRFQLVNREAAEVYNASPDTLLGKTLADVHPIPDQVVSFEQEDQAVLQSGCASWRPAVMSNEQIYEVNRIPLKNLAGQTYRLLVVATDITQRKQAEAALRESEQKYRHLVETMHGGLVIFDGAGRATYANDRLCEMLGYAREELLGRTAYEFVAEEHALLLGTEFNKRLAGESSAYELVAKRKNGQQLHLLVSSSPLRNDQEEVIGTLGVLLDIETQKQAEAALHENLKKEKELGELKSRFVSMASHEFRTPLASILALTETLRAYRHKLGDEQIDGRLGKIQEQIGYLKAIMEDVLQLARLQARRAEFNPAPLDLDALCHSVLDEFQGNPEEAKRLIYAYDAALQSIVLDKKLMRQVINNLVSNALKYSPLDKPVNVTLMHIDQTLVLTVQDRGIGIPEADLAHLFQLFHRATNVGTISGTGLGLAITKESVELHGGTITVESQVGVGTLVTVRIPLTISSEKTTKQLSDS